MDSKRITERLTPLVVDEVKWSRFEDYLDFKEQELMASLKTSGDIRQINKLQGKLELLDLFQRLPQTIREMK